MSEEYMRSVADLMAFAGEARPPIKTRGNIVISDTRLVGLREVDLGWGPPAYGGVAAATSTVTTFGSYKGGKFGREGIVVPVCLPAQAMLRLELELKKMVWEPRNNKFYDDKSVAKIVSML